MLFRSEVLRLDDRPGHQSKPRFLNMIANTASSRMTTVIAATTEVVIEFDTLSVFGFVCNPK